MPESIKEAAVAFGASKWQLLKDVEIPLALPSIMTGVNQTILMCLSMVVIISLIGGGGLGKEILEALQYAAKGPGLLGALRSCSLPWSWTGSCRARSDEKTKNSERKRPRF